MNTYSTTTKLQLKKRPFHQLPNRYDYNIKLIDILDNRGNILKRAE